MYKKNIALLTFSFLLIVSANTQDKFSFAIIADPQLSARESKNKVATDAWQTLEKACEEINRMKPAIDFTVFLGDLVNTWEPRSVDNFRKSIAGLKTPVYLVHGNHDGKSPYQGFKALQREYNDIQSTYYSFSKGKWHFITLTCDFRMKEAELNWLEKELNENKEKPTIIFQHLHFIPLGLSQLEFYGFDLASKKRLIDLMTRHGNVKYYFNGHVHNGIQPSVKMSKTFRGIQFVTVPTIIHSRPFGEEFPDFQKGLERGGYYMSVHVDGDKITLNGHLTDESTVYTYPALLAEFDEKLEPRWNKTLLELPGAPSFLNGNFSGDMKHWQTKLRYMSDKNPAYINEVRKIGSNKLLYISTRSTPPESWANDEYTEIYQIIDKPLATDVSFSFDYGVEQCVNGGGFARVTLIDEKGEPLLFFFHWGENEKEASYLPRCIGFEILGKSAGWNYLRELGAARKALFVRLPAQQRDKMQKAGFNLESLYDQAINKPGAYSKLNICKAMISLGTWVNKEIGSVSSAWFDNIHFGTSQKMEKPLLDNSVNTSKIFTTEFGQSLDERVKSRRAVGSN